MDSVSDLALNLPEGFDNEVWLLDAKVRLKNNEDRTDYFKILVTDFRFIMTKDTDSYQEDASFMISTIKYLVQSELNPKNFLILAKNQPTYFLCAKRYQEVIDLLCSLFFKLTQKHLVIYKVPRKNLKKYEISKRDSINGNYSKPSKEYLVKKQEHHEVKSKDRSKTAKNKEKGKKDKNDVSESPAIENKDTTKEDVKSIEDQQETMFEEDSKLVLNKNEYQEDKDVQNIFCL